jgi:hypothetical protein
MAAFSLLAQVSAAGVLMLLAGPASSWPRLVPHDSAPVVAAPSFELSPASYPSVQRQLVSGLTYGARTQAGFSP